jgi:hypothetical protein
MNILGSYPQDVDPGYFYTTYAATSGFTMVRVPFVLVPGLSDVCFSFIL